MPQQFSDDEVRRAAQNLQRIQEFFQARASWTIPAGASEGFKASHRSVASIVGLLEPVLARSGIRSGESASAATHATSQTPGELDASKLTRFTAFFEQLEGWVRAHRDAEVPLPSAAPLKRVFSIAVATARVMEQILDGNALTYNPLRLAHDSAAAATLESSSPPPPDAEGPFAPSTQLELVPCEETPLLQEVNNRLELTSETVAVIDGFLKEAGISHSDGEHRRFLRKVVDWIDSTPERHNLVMRVSALHGRLEPYPSYVQVEEEEDELS